MEWVGNNALQLKVCNFYDYAHEVCHYNETKSPQKLIPLIIRFRVGNSINVEQF